MLYPDFPFPSSQGWISLAVTCLAFLRLVSFFCALANSRTLAGRDGICRHRTGGFFLVVDSNRG